MVVDLDNLFEQRLVGHNAGIEVRSDLDAVGLGFAAHAEEDFAFERDVEQADLSCFGAVVGVGFVNRLFDSGGIGEACLLGVAAELIAERNIQSDVAEAVIDDDGAVVRVGFGLEDVIDQAVGLAAFGVIELDAHRLACDADADCGAGGVAGSVLVEGDVKGEAGEQRVERGEQIAAETDCIENLGDRRDGAQTLRQQAADAISGICHRGSDLVEQIVGQRDGIGRAGRGALDVEGQDAGNNAGDTARVNRAHFVDLVGYIDIDVNRIGREGLRKAGSADLEHLFAELGEDVVVLRAAVVDIPKAEQSRGRLAHGVGDGDAESVLGTGRSECGVELGREVETEVNLDLDVVAARFGLVAFLVGVRRLIEGDVRGDVAAHRGEVAHRAHAVNDFVEIREEVVPTLFRAEDLGALVASVVVVRVYVVAESAGIDIRAAKVALTVAIRVCVLVLNCSAAGVAPVVAVFVDVSVFGAIMAASDESCHHCGDNHHYDENLPQQMRFFHNITS